MGKQWQGSTIVYIAEICIHFYNFYIHFFMIYNTFLISIKKKSLYKVTLLVSLLSTFSLVAQAAQGQSPFSRNWTWLEKGQTLFTLASLYLLKKVLKL